MITLVKNGHRVKYHFRIVHQSLQPYIDRFRHSETERLNKTVKSCL